MNFEKTISDFEKLPYAAKKEVADFIAFLKSRYLSTKKSDNMIKSKLVEEEFIGLWKDREDLMDSTAWIRDIRRKEWKTNG